VPRVQVTWVCVVREPKALRCSVWCGGGANAVGAVMSAVGVKVARPAASTHGMGSARSACPRAMGAFCWKAVEKQKAAVKRKNECQAVQMKQEEQGGHMCEVQRHGKVWQARGKQCVWVGWGGVGGGKQCGGGGVHKGMVGEGRCVVATVQGGGGRWWQWWWVVEGKGVVWARCVVWRCMGY